MYYVYTYILQILLYNTLYIYTIIHEVFGSLENLGALTGQSTAVSALKPRYLAAQSRLGCDVRRSAETTSSELLDSKRAQHGQQMLMRVGECQIFWQVASFLGCFLDWPLTGMTCFLDLNGCPKNEFTGCAVWERLRTQNPRPTL